MYIIADENIPCVRSAFATLGTVQTVAGRQLQRATLEKADILLVRSVTQVNEALLSGSAIRFVGTATIGCDHIDLDYLEKQNITFASAPGSNATSTAEYVISALFILAERQGFKLTDKTVGIIGCGNVGSRVLKKLQGLDIPCRVYDPLRQEMTASQDEIPFVSLKTVLTSDIITLHVPLTRGGAYPTEYMVDKTFLSQLSEQAILINTSRGNVIDEQALQARLNQSPNMTVVLDVWNNEPAINLQLLEQVALGTPHIAGYSIEGKVRGTEMLYKAVCTYLNETTTWMAQHGLPPPPLSQLTFTATVEDSDALKTAVMACYDVRRDDALLRSIMKASDPSCYFDKLRKHYQLRREFNSVRVEVPPIKTILAKQLESLGFQVTVTDQMEKSALG